MSESVVSLPTRPLATHERRKHLRKKSLLTAVLVAQAGSFDCRVYDLSSGGARVESSARVSPGEPVVLIVGSNRASGGTVVWCTDGCFGMRFSNQRAEAVADAAAPAAPEERHGRASAPSMRFVEFKRYQGGVVYVNPAQVLYVSAQGDGNYCELHFVRDAHVIVSGDCKRVCSQLTG
ncbi:MAG TPA: PilZ domain-containing protein [Stellaceae bacterium]|nr:PilZ domain-containing protein [Stellaceae bacterium]